jgi:hypothetical protein
VINNSFYALTMVMLFDERAGGVLEVLNALEDSFSPEQHPDA